MTISHQVSNVRVMSLLGQVLRMMVLGSILLVIGCCYPMTVAAAERHTGPDTATLFEFHCAGCHPGGSNIIRRGKNLRQRALQRQGYTTPAAIAQLITKGKSAMSGYADRLSPEEIDSLAQYVLDQAERGWS